jgi:uncharacterized protein (DUF58 family)
MTDLGEISYRPRGRAEGLRPGAHRGRTAGGYGVFLDHVPYLRHPDPRRIDLRMTLRDPFETIYVRRYEQRAAISVYAVVDLSASMRFEGAARKLDLISDLCRSLARSTRRLGDAFGIIGADSHVRQEFFFPAMRRSGREAEIARRFESFVPEVANASGLADAAPYLSGKRKLVFLISDFEMPLEQIATILRSLASHDVVPIIVSDSAEEKALPNFGLIEVRDLETGGRRLVMMRPALRRRWLEAAAARRQSLTRLFARYARLPFMLADRLDTDRLSRHLLET